MASGIVTQGGRAILNKIRSAFQAFAGHENSGLIARVEFGQ